MDKNTTSMTEFQTFLRKQNASANTVLAYTSSVRLYFSLWGSISPENLLSYRVYLISHYKPNTVNTRIRGINRYLDFLFSDDSPQKLSLLRLPSIREQQRSFLDTIISNEDYIRFKTNLKQNQQMFWYFVIRFLAATGARISELTQIKMEHLDIGYMDLYSKGGKVRRIYFPDSLCREAIIWFQSQNITTGFLFLNRSSKPMSPRGISSRLKDLAKTYQIPPETVYPHSFRHRFAKNFLAKSNDISLLADLMGHESIETTRIYLMRSSREQREVIDQVVTW